VEPNTTDNSVPREITALLSDERLILRETKRAMTPFGGVAVFVAFLRKIDLIGKIRQCMSVCGDPSAATALAGASRLLNAAPAPAMMPADDSGCLRFMAKFSNRLLGQVGTPTWFPDTI
jgi:hypothetical protein